MIAYKSIRIITNICNYINYLCKSIMSNYERKDDPRDVLAFLNSLGFVGITAPQLKSFLKDLKLYRKIKQREREEWKEKVRQNILKKQNPSLNRILQDHGHATNVQTPQYSTSESQVSAEDPVFKIKIKCASKDKENRRKECLNHGQENIKELNKVTALIETNDRKNVQTNYCSQEDVACEAFSRLALYQDVPKTAKSSKSNKIDFEKDKGAKPKRCISAPEMTQRPSRHRLRSAGSDSAKTLDTRRSSRSKSSRDCSRSKSFIRPWKLQPESQASLVRKKSDPVSLYHKYQQEWKQLLLPGEERHAKVRWEVREKMLGCDPNPRPTLWKSASASMLKKR